MKKPFNKLKNSKAMPHIQRLRAITLLPPMLLIKAAIQSGTTMG
jgi:hypothetical protein